MQVAAPRCTGISTLCPASFAGPCCQEPPVPVDVVLALPLAPSLPCTCSQQRVPGFGTGCFRFHRALVLAFCQDPITDGIILLDDFRAEPPARPCVEGRKDILVSLVLGYIVL